MKRDMDTIRKIVLATAELPYGHVLSSVDGIDTEEYITHCAWLKEAGLIVATVEEGSGSMAKVALIIRLTWDGCEFADAIASDTLWAKAKDNVLKPGISFTFGVLKEWLKTEITQGLPSMR